MRWSEIGHASDRGRQAQRLLGKAVTLKQKLGGDLVRLARDSGFRSPTQRGVIVEKKLVSMLGKDEMPDFVEYAKALSLVAQARLCRNEPVVKA
jgi:hypothetical protein